VDVEEFRRFADSNYFAFLGRFRTSGHALDIGAPAIENQTHRI
jgi:hypothetical protein